MEAHLMEPQLIEPSQIQSELTRIWENLEGANKTRACLFNLIIYAEKDRREAYLHTIAQKVIDKFPSRVIYISADKASKEDFLKTSVSVLFAGKKECDVACDLIHIDVAGFKQMRVPFLILPHILPDLPVYLVWAEDPANENLIFTQIENLATRLIFDSESTDNLPRFAETLLKYQADQVDIADLNWARMESWRQLFSASFHSDETLAQLKRAQKIQIHYNASETPFFCHTRIQAIYLQAWLACQLDWEPFSVRPEKEKILFSYRYKNQTIDVELTPSNHPELAAGTLVSVDLETTQGEHFAFTRNPEAPNHIIINTSCQDKCTLPVQFIFAKAQSGQSLVKEICHKGINAHYISVLKLIGKMKELALC